MACRSPATRALAVAVPSLIRNFGRVNEELGHPQQARGHLGAGREDRQRHSTSPRATSISRSNVNVTAWPASAAARSPSAVTIRVDVGALPARQSDQLLMCTRTTPEATVPA